MAELVDALVSGTSRGNSVEVRVFLAASHYTQFSSSHISEYCSCFAVFGADY